MIARSGVPVVGLTMLLGCPSPPEPEPPAAVPSPPAQSSATPKPKGNKAPGIKGGPRGDHRPDRSTPNAPGPTILAKDGMVYVTGSWLVFGPRTPPPVADFQPGPPPAGAPPSDGSDAAEHGAGGKARASGGPPGQTEARELAGVPDNPVPWEFHGGNGIDHTDVWVDAFWIDQTEVTRAAYARFIAESGYRPPFVAEEWAADGWNWHGATPPEGTEDHPVVLVSWYDAREYCAWAGKRLPTEAEWQLAALGPWGQSRDYPWGNTYEDSRLNHGQMLPPNFDDSDGYLTTAPVGQFPTGASPFGAQDMFGNAWEYTADLRVDTWSLMSTVDAATRAHQGGKRQVRALEPGLYAAVRGGSYFFDLRPNPGGERHRFLTEIRRKTSGFRCAKDNDRPAPTERSP